MDDAPSDLDPLGDPRASGGFIAAPAIAIRPGILAVHVLAVTLIQATAFCVQMTLMPMLVQRGFGANKWQTLLTTASPTALFVMSIFWNDLFSRQRLARYLAVFWFTAGLPMAMIGLAQDFWTALVPHLVACIGACGYYPIAGELFKRLYPERSRGRMYAVVWGASTVGGIIIAAVAGDQLDQDGRAYRWIMPAAAALQLVGVVTLWLLARAAGIAATHNAQADRLAAETASAPHLRALLEPVLHLRQVLRADPVFFRYEAAYMTYGIGWMIGVALLPLLADRKLGLGYRDYAHSTQIAYQVAVVAMIWPAGWLMDRLGAIRSVALSFGLLSLYPLGLVVSGDVRDLMFASIVFGIAHAGASVGWMLGPVALAPTPAKVAQYVAIHATLVGLRGTLFQGLGVVLYAVTGGFTWPLVLAAIAYIWSAAQMWTLHGRARAGRIEQRGAGRRAAELEAPAGHHDQEPERAAPSVTR